MAQSNPESSGDPLDPTHPGGDNDFPPPSELGQYFLDQFRQRVAGLESSLDELDVDIVRQLTSELRADADACDFARVCSEAWQLETGAFDAGELDALTDRVEDLITLCRQTANR